MPEDFSTLPTFNNSGSTVALACPLENVENMSATEINCTLYTSVLCSFPFKLVHTHPWHSVENTLVHVCCALHRVLYGELDVAQPARACRSSSSALAPVCLHSLRAACRPSPSALPPVSLSSASCVSFVWEKREHSPSILQLTHDTNISPPPAIISLSSISPSTPSFYT